MKQTEKRMPYRLPKTFILANRKVFACDDGTKVALVCHRDSGQFAWWSLANGSVWEIVNFADVSKWADVETTIRHFRITHMLTQRQFGDRVGVTPTAVTLWETGRRKPNAATKEKIAQAFGDDFAKSL